MRKLAYFTSFLLFLFIFPVSVFAAVAAPDSAVSGIGAIDKYVEAITDAQNNDQVSSEYYMMNSMNNMGAYWFDNILIGQADQAGTAFVPAMSSFISQMYSNPPANSETYIADVLNSAKIGIAQPAYAQGIGFSSLTPILDTWKIFRNIAYLFFVLIFLFIGFLIMFRRKVGQTAVTAQQALPKIIIALIAVTFSYAIAGFLIDLMYLIMYFLVGIFGASTTLINKNIFEFGLEVIKGDGLSAVDDAYHAVSNLVTQSLGSSSVVTQGLGFISGITAAVVIAFALAFGIFRIFFELLKTYVSIIISIVTAPLLLMLEAIPGRNMFGQWVKSLIGNLAAFPILLIILILYNKITAAGSLSSGGGFMPPYLIGQGNGNALAVLFGLGLILVAEKIIKDGKKAMGATGGFFDQYAGEAGNALKRGWSGGELVPGLGFTNTSKVPVVGSAKEFGRKATIAGIALPAGAYGLVEGPIKRRRSGMADVSAWTQAQTRTSQAARRVGTLLGDRHIKKKEERKQS